QAQRLDVVEEVDEHVGARRDHAHAAALAGLLQLTQEPGEVVLQVVHEALHDAGSTAGADGLDAGRHPAALGPAGPDLVGAARRQEVLEQHALDAAAAGQPVERRAVGLAVIGQHVEVPAMLGDAPGRAPELVDRAVDRAQHAQGATIAGTVGVGYDVV